MDRALRRVAGPLLVVVAFASLLLAWEALSKLGGYQDSPAAVYILFGGFWLVVAGAAGLGAHRLLRRR
ncbi:MAG: hypothetical protein QOE11_1027 [Solirubrobacteraceae bacterium]|nr:hypothetical protein [Solirubrobacteraceae bacterium]